jgi:hypothetical protein
MYEFMYEYDLEFDAFCTVIDKTWRDPLRHTGFC